MVRVRARAWLAAMYTRATGRHPFFQVLYVVMYAICCACLHSNIDRWVGYIGDPVHVHIAYAAAATALWTFVVLCVSDPGVVTAANHADMEKKYAAYYDQTLFPRGAGCRTCGFDKVALSKHCTRCDHCVANFDHHCFWLNVCIGEKNRLDFLYFLIVHGLGSIYTVWCLGTCMLGIIDERHLWDQEFMDKHGANMDFNYATLYRYLLQEEKVTTTLFTLAVLVAPLINTMMLTHLRLYSLGETLNLHVKRARLRKQR